MKYQSRKRETLLKTTRLSFNNFYKIRSVSGSLTLMNIGPKSHQQAIEIEPMGTQGLDLF